MKKSFFRLKHCFIMFCYLVHLRIISEHYTYAKTDWGPIYFKLFGKTNYHDAAFKCETDGGTLPIPKSGQCSNKFQLKILVSFHRTVKF